MINGSHGAILETRFQTHGNEFRQVRIKFLSSRQDVRHGGSMCETLGPDFVCAQSSEMDLMGAQVQIIQARSAMKGFVHVMRDGGHVFVTVLSILMRCPGWGWWSRVLMSSISRNCSVPFG